jgi:hypothetical protein
MTSEVEELRKLDKSILGICGLVVRIPGYKSRGPGSILGATRSFEKWWVWNGVHSALSVQLRSYLQEIVAAQI